MGGVRGLRAADRLGRGLVPVLVVVLHQPERDLHGAEVAQAVEAAREAQVARLPVDRQQRLRPPELRADHRDEVLQSVRGLRLRAFQATLPGELSRVRAWIFVTVRSRIRSRFPPHVGVHAVADGILEPPRARHVPGTRDLGRGAVPGVPRSRRARELRGQAVDRPLPLGVVPEPRARARGDGRAAAARGARGGCPRNTSA